MKTAQGLMCGWHGHVCVMLSVFFVISTLTQLSDIAQGFTRLQKHVKELLPFTYLRVNI